MRERGKREIVKERERGKREIVKERERKRENEEKGDRERMRKGYKNKEMIIK